MDQDKDHEGRLSTVLAHLSDALQDKAVSVGEIARHLGQDGLAGLVLVFSLIAVSPASTVPGVTTMVAMVDFLLVAQMAAGRRVAWLPSFVARREFDAQKLRKGAQWLQRPVRWVERFLHARLDALVHRPWALVPMLLVLGTCLMMPFLEVVPTTGSIAATAISLFAAGMLARDGAVVGIATLALAVLPLGVAWFVFFR